MANVSRTAASFLSRPMLTQLVSEGLEIASQRFTLRDISSSDISDVLQLHRHVFGSAVDAAWFEWKYVRGQGEGVGLWHDGRLVAFCGGTPRWIWNRGARARYLQIGDVMVAPEWRGVLARKSPFYYVSERFYRSRLGEGHDFVAAFGFPNTRHLRLAVKMGLSWDAGSVSSLLWTLDNTTLPRLGWSWRTERLDCHAPGFDGAVDHAWQAMLRGSLEGFLGERDAQYLRWRFVDRPDRKYRFLGLQRRWQQQACGVAVFAAPAQAGDALQWLDWVGPSEWLPQACATGMALARSEGAAGLATWASPAVASRLASTAPVCTGQAAGVGVPRASALSGEQVAQLHCWWTGGDTDFL